MGKRYRCVVRLCLHTTVLIWLLREHVSHTQGACMRTSLIVLAHFTIQRHKFTTSFTIQALRSSLIWRLTSLSAYLASMNRPQTTEIIRVLPRHCLDPFGRPVIVFDLGAFLSLLSKSLDDAKDFILLIAENLRLYLRQLNERDGHEGPILQYVVIVNVEGVSWAGSVSAVSGRGLLTDSPRFRALIC